MRNLFFTVCLICFTSCSFKKNVWHDNFNLPNGTSIANSANWAVTNATNFEFGVPGDGKNFACYATNGMLYLNAGTTPPPGPNEPVICFQPLQDKKTLFFDLKNKNLKLKFELINISHNNRGRWNMKKNQELKFYFSEKIVSQNQYRLTNNYYNFTIGVNATGKSNLIFYSTFQNTDNFVGCSFSLELTSASVFSIFTNNVLWASVTNAIPSKKLEKVFIGICHLKFSEGAISADGSIIIDNLKINTY